MPFVNISWHRLKDSVQGNSVEHMTVRDQMKKYSGERRRLSHPLIGGLHFVVTVPAPEDLSTARGHHAATAPVVLAAVL
jgi:hypothetical protein